jgi:hypothetical protein
MIPIPVPMPFGTPGERRKLDEARGEIATLRDVVAEMQRRVEKQAVLLRALFVVLSERQGYTEAELLDRFRQVEAERASAPAKKCAQCGRAVNQRTQRCLYCGAECQVETAFELLELGTWPHPALHPTGPALRSPEEHGITSRPGG